MAQCCQSSFSLDMGTFLVFPPLESKGQHSGTQPHRFNLFPTSDQGSETSAQALIDNQGDRNPAAVGTWAGGWQEWCCMYLGR